MWNYEIISVGHLLWATTCSTFCNKVHSIRSSSFTCEHQSRTFRTNFCNHACKSFDPALIILDISSFLHRPNNFPLSNRLTSSSTTVASFFYCSHYHTINLESSDCKAKLFIRYSNEVTQFVLIFILKRFQNFLQRSSCQKRFVLAGKCFS